MNNVGDKVFAKHDIIQGADSDNGTPAFLLAKKGEELTIMIIDEIKTIWPILVMNTIDETFWVSEVEITHDKNQ